jgi:tripeptide aminopeptidase
VKPQIIPNYEKILLNWSKILFCPLIISKIITIQRTNTNHTDGTTLLGADDKAGITEIVTAMEFLINNPEIKHGKIRVGFTPDEEIGRGAHHFDVEKLELNGLTMDGSKVGE